MSRMGGRKGGRKPRDTFYPGYGRTDGQLATMRKALREYAVPKPSSASGSTGSSGARTERDNAPSDGQPVQDSLHINNNSSAIWTIGVAANIGGVVADFFFIRGSRAGSGQLRIWEDTPFDGTVYTAAIIRIDPENPGITEPPTVAVVSGDLQLTVAISNDTDDLDMNIIYTWTRRI